MIPNARWTVAAVAAVGGVGELFRRRQSARNPPPPPVTTESKAPPPPVTTQSSPGQIADLQQAFGADMGPRSGEPGGDTGVPG